MLAFPLCCSQTLNTVSCVELLQGTVVGLLGSWWTIKSLGHGKVGTQCVQVWIRDVNQEQEE